MLKTLFRKQFMELFQGYFVNKKTGQAKKRVQIVIGFVLFGLLILALGFFFYTMGASLGGFLFGTKLEWVYFVVVGLLAMAFGVFGSVFNTYASLYLPKDNELLLSLPIPIRTVLLVRLSNVYLTSFLYSAWLWIPCVIAYWVACCPLSVKAIVCPLFMTFVVALFVSVLSCILGFFVALIAQKTKGKSYMKTILSLVLVALYYVVYFKVMDNLTEIVSYMAVIGSTVESKFHYLYWMGLGSVGSIQYTLLVAGITLLLGAICFFVLSRTFLKLVFADTSAKKKAIRSDAYDQKTVKKALIYRELRHFVSVSTWMLNGGLGLVLLPAITIAMLVKGSVLANILYAMGDPIVPMAMVALLGLVCMTISTNAISPVAVSIEGKSLWIVQALPVSSFQTLWSKVQMNVLLNALPAAFAIVAIGLVLRFEIWNIAFLLIAAILYMYWNATISIVLNLKWPNLSWTNAATLTKQSVPVMIALFGGWVFCGLFVFAAYFLLKVFPITVILGLYALLFAGLFYLAFRWLKTTGAKVFSKLN